MSEFPKKISDNGWYELSDGNTVRGEEAAIRAEEDLQSANEAEDELEREEEEAPREYEGGDDLDPAGKKCANCGGDATVVDNPPTANPVFFCDRDRPIYMR